MSRLRPLDRVLILTLVPLALAWLAIHVHAGVNGRFGYPDGKWRCDPAPSPDAYPIVTSSDEPEIEAGDQVIRVGDADFRGVMTPVGLWTRLNEQFFDQPRVTFEFEREGERFERTEQWVPWPIWWVNIPFAIGGLVVAVIILLRAPQWHLSKTVFLLLILLIFFFVRQQGGSLLLHTWSVAFAASGTLSTGLVFWCVYHFPERRISAHRRALGVSLLFGLPTALYHIVWQASFLFPLPQPPRDLFMIGQRVFVLAMAVTLAWMAIRNYRSSDPAGRRQIKWIVYGFFVLLVPWTLAIVGWDYIPDGWHDPVYVSTAVGRLGAPIGILIAIFGYRFLDINPLISATASFTVLSVLFFAAVLTLVPRIAEAAGPAVGADPASAQLFFSVALAAVAVPIHRSLRPRIDRLFFPERQTFEQGVEGLVAELSSLPNPNALLKRAGDDIARLLKIDSCVVYARGGEAYEPVFAQGRVVPPAFASDSPLVATLRGQSGALVAERFSPRGGTDHLSPFDRSAIETLGAAVVFPIRRGSELAAFLCLGAKQSGDIYTRTDLALLRLVADRLSLELQRFDDAEILRESRAMQEQLRRYVPGAVADELSSGQRLEAGEREVSVLFVDIRGFMALADPQTIQNLRALHPLVGQQEFRF